MFDTVEQAIAYAQARDELMNPDEIVAKAIARMEYIWN